MADEEWTIVEIHVDLKHKELVEHRSGKKLVDILENHVSHLNALYSTYLRILNRCTECGKEVIIYAPKTWRKKSIVMLRHAEAKCNICYPRSRWRRIK